MQNDPTPADGAVALAPVALAPVAGAGRADGAVALPRLPPLFARLRTALARIAVAPAAGRVALACLVVGTFAVVAFATAGVNILVPRSYLTYPTWEAGPLHALFRWLPTDYWALSIGFSVVGVAMLAAYAVLLASVRTISMRAIVICIVAVHAIVLLSPPQQLTDVFNYLGYARLGGLHHLNPYTNVIAGEIHDPVFRFASWHNLHSPYGPLFTALSYPLAFLSLPLAYWTVKVATLLASLAFIALVWQCARQLGRDPRFAVAFVALNPIYVLYAISGFHNDFFMLVPSTAAIWLLLARRDRAAGGVLMLAVAVKFTALLLLPFLLVAARRSRRRRDIVVGAALGAVPLVALSLALFGFSLPNLSDQTTLLTDFSIPNLVGLAIGVGGGAPGVLRAASVALVLSTAYLLRRRGDWIANAGWATLALIASLAWLMPWYVIWLLPLAALGTSLRLRRAALVLTVFLLATFLPVIWMVLGVAGINPMATSVGQASATLQGKLAQ
jgi:hypothetical protein